MNKLTNVNGGYSVQFSSNRYEVCVESPSGRAAGTMIFKDINQKCSLECRLMKWECPDHNHISPPNRLELTGIPQHFRKFLEYISTTSILQSSIKTLVIKEICSEQIELFSELIKVLPDVENLYIGKCLMDDGKVATVIKGMKKCRTLEIQLPYYSLDNQVISNIVRVEDYLRGIIQVTGIYTEHQNPKMSNVARESADKLMIVMTIKGMIKEYIDRMLLLVLCIRIFHSAFEIKVNISEECIKGLKFRLSLE